IKIGPGALPSVLRLLEGTTTDAALSTDRYWSSLPYTHLTSHADVAAYQIVREIGVSACPILLSILTSGEQTEQTSALRAFSAFTQQSPQTSYDTDEFANVFKPSACINVPEERSGSRIPALLARAQLQGASNRDE